MADALEAPRVTVIRGEDGEIPVVVAVIAVPAVPGAGALATIDAEDRARLDKDTQRWAQRTLGQTQLALKVLKIKEAFDLGDWKGQAGALEDCASLCIHWSRWIREQHPPRSKPSRRRSSGDSGGRTP